MVVRAAFMMPVRGIVNAAHTLKRFYSEEGLKSIPESSPTYIINPPEIYHHKPLTIHSSSGYTSTIFIVV